MRVRLSSRSPWRGTNAPWFAIHCLNAFKLEKYRAEPNPVRSAEGSVPRQRPRIGCGDARILRMVKRSAEVWCACWILVFRRSAGWRRMAEESPEARPAMKWNFGFEA